MSETAASRDRRNPWPALTLVVVAVLAWFAFQTVQLVRERTSLQAAKASQDATLAQAEKLRAQLDSIASKTLELAQQGNANATLIVQELARRGVSINASAVPARGDNAPAAPDVRRTP
jgi:Tfp pilus assembly protein PilE